MNQLMLPFQKVTAPLLTFLKTVIDVLEVQRSLDQLMRTWFRLWYNHV